MKKKITAMLLAICCICLLYTSSRTDGDCQGGKNAVYDPQQGCSQGYAGAGEGMHERGNAWRDYPLFFLWKGNGKDVYKRQGNRRGNRDLSDAGGTSYPESI